MNRLNRCLNRCLGQCLFSGQVDFAETMETENRNGNRKHRKYCAWSQVPSCTVDLTSDAALVHVFFSCFCSCSVWHAATSVP